MASKAPSGCDIGEIKWERELLINHSNKSGKNREKRKWGKYCTRQKYRGLEYGTPNCTGLKINSCLEKSAFSNISINFVCVSDVCNKRNASQVRWRISKINFSSQISSRNKPQIQQRFPWIALLVALMLVTSTQESWWMKMHEHRQNAFVDLIIWCTIIHFPVYNMHKMVASNLGQIILFEGL